MISGKDKILAKKILKHCEEENYTMVETLSQFRLIGISTVEALDFLVEYQKEKEKDNDYEYQDI